ncbi:hypothetical protein F3Y22_tig00002919pilonHSYRG00132 [Hibiscus syriacus]|uniref:Association with the SNF1 complex (ASC) domain-containing protein n=1 Tax=Hibiscus syriacus TaxID=106335 RepID=A0A6A3CTU3_HIBSY|nr:hypothetical protein F3Y22_tig00002919pilonHSYRG00132 [Hibiscus syriacus]
MFPWLRSAEVIQDQNDVLVQNTNLPWEYNDSGRPLNLQISGAPLPDLVKEPLHSLGKDFIIMKMLPCEAPESLSEFEPPPSRYRAMNQPLNNSDFSKPPPELPPQLPTKIVDERSFINRKPKSSRRPSHTLLDHLYKQDGDDGQSMALCSTQRFLQKYVTVVLYKSVHR